MVAIIIDSVCPQTSLLCFEAGFNQGIRHEETAAEVRTAMQEERRKIPPTSSTGSRILQQGDHGGTPSRGPTTQTSRTIGYWRERGTGHSRYDSNHLAPK